MPVLEYTEVKGKVRKIAVDDEGYLVNMDDWDESVAKALAKREGMDELAADQIDILKFVREYYRKYNFFPILGAICKNVNKPRDCMTEKFPVPLVAWKLAGLPHPNEPVISLLEAGQSPG